MNSTEFLLYWLYGFRIKIKPMSLRRLGYILKKEKEVYTTLNSFTLVETNRGVFLDGLAGFTRVKAGPLTGKYKNIVFCGEAGYVLTVSNEYDQELINNLPHKGEVK